MDERERQKLIEKLGTAKTSEERDRVLRDLANRDRSAPGEPQGAEATGVVKPATEKPEGKALVRLSPNLRAIILLVIAVCGLFFVVTEGMKIMEGRQLGPAESKRFFMGFLILVFGILGFLKTKRAEGKAGGETDESSVDSKPSAGMKALILLMMVFGGLYLITNAVMSIMQGRWGAFEIIMLIQGFAFLFAAIFIFYKERAKEKAGGETEKRSPPPTISD
jgi:hypothetical protein